VGTKGAVVNQGIIERSAILKELLLKVFNGFVG